MTTKSHALFEHLPLGAIRPQGWLLDQLCIQAEGLTGHLEEHWPDVGSDNGWLGGKGDSWERGPYYVDGLLPLAYLLQDDALIAKANRWVNWTLSSQREDGSFGPMHIKTVNQDVDKQQDWWHDMIMLKVLTQYEEATSDPRVVPFLTRYFHYVSDNIKKQPLRGWAEARGAEMSLVLLWLHRRTDEDFLLDLAAILTQQTIDWSSVFYEFPFWQKVEQWDWKTHVVNVAMGIKAPGIIYERTGEPVHKEAVHRGIDALMMYHGQAHGMFSGDEWLSGTHPSQGVELCAVVEYMFAMEQLTRIFGEGRFGDILEKVAFNALPAAISTDWCSHQYDQQVNQVLCNAAPRNWVNSDEANLFGLEPNFGCCTANMHQGWPKFTSHLWMSDQQGGLAVVSYAPCQITAMVGAPPHLTQAVWTVSGDYPFREQVTMRLAVTQSVAFGLSLRLPEWCAAPQLFINGEEAALADTGSGYAQIVRTWCNGDTLSLYLPMAVKMAARGHLAVSVERGPLVFALPIEENWQMVQRRDKFHDWEVYPASPWKYGLLADSQAVASEAPIARQPFDARQSPICIRVPGQLVREWKMQHHSAGTLPLHPARHDEQRVDLALVPYGGAKLRIAEFPIVAHPLQARKHL